LELRQWLGMSLGCHGVSWPEEQHFAEAEAEIRSAHAGFIALYGANSSEALFSEELLADLYLYYEFFAEALPLYQHVYNGRQLIYGVGSLRALRAKLYSVLCLDLVGDTPEAVRSARDLLNSIRLYQAKSDYYYRYALLVAAKALLDAHLTGEASPLIDEFDQIVHGEQLTEPEFIFEGQLAYLKGIRSQQSGDIPAATVFLTKAASLLSLSQGPNNVVTRDAKARLAEAINAQTTPKAH
jgi:hypothetical protein